MHKNTVIREGFAKSVGNETNNKDVLFLNIDFRNLVYQKFIHFSSIKYSLKIHQKNKGFNDKLIFKVLEIKTRKTLKKVETKL